MSKWPNWVSESTNPTGHEVGKLVNPIDPELVEAASDATSPLDREVNRLLRSRANVVVNTEPSWFDLWGVEPRQVAMVGVGAAALVAVAGYTQMPVNYAPIGSPIGEVAEWHGNFELGPSIDVEADGLLRVAKADREGTVVDLLEGEASFDVLPGGDYRALTVTALDVEVEVVGTLFDVSIDNGVVWVGCERGKVEVRYAGLEFFVEGGQSWNTAEMAVAMVEAKPAAGGGSGVGDAPSSSSDVAAAPVVPRAVLGVPAADVMVEEIVGAEGTDEPEEGWKRPKSAAGEIVGLKRRMLRGENASVMLAKWDGYLERWPDAYEIEEAKLYRLQAKAAVEPTRATVDDLSNYAAGVDVAARPDLATDAHDLRVVVATEYLGDCGLVLDSYRWLAIHEGQAKAAVASAYLGLCSATDDGEATEALNRALALGLGDSKLRSEVEVALAAKE